MRAVMVFTLLAMCLVAAAYGASIDINCHQAECFVDPCAYTRCAAGYMCKSCNCQASCEKTTV